MELAANEYRQGKDLLFAVCDVECLDKHYKEGKLTLKVDSEFYDGRRIGEEEFRLIMGRATVGNFVGERTVGLAVALGFVGEENVLHIEGVPHAQWALLF